MKPNWLQLERLQSTLTMQFPDLDVKTVLSDIVIQVSKKTGRIRGVFDPQTNTQLFSLRTSDGRFLPTFAGAVRIQNSGYPHFRIIMTDEAVPFIATGKSAFCKHVIHADPLIQPQSEVFLYSKHGELLAVGTAQQPGYAILELESGLAARVKHCRDKQ